MTQDGKAISGSPFKITIDEHHVSSSQKVKVAGHIKDAMANQWNDVTVNIAEAGVSSVAFVKAKCERCGGSNCSAVGEVLIKVEPGICGCNKNILLIWHVNFNVHFTSFVLHGLVDKPYHRVANFMKI